MVSVEPELGIQVVALHLHELEVSEPRSDFDPRPVMLEGDHVRLEPLRMEHAPALFAAGDEDDIWRYVLPRPLGVDGYTRYIRWALDQTVLGQQDRQPVVVYQP